MTAEKTSRQIPLSIIALNYFPVAYLGALVALLGCLTISIGQATVLLIFWIYLLPPMVCRLVLGICGEPANHATIHSAAFRNWWLLTQLQMLFNRFPALEELLRLFPAVYSLWLGLWGSRVSPFVLWSPEVRVTDRYLLKIEAEAVIGWGAVLAPHLVALNAEGEAELILGKIEIGKGAIIGGKTVIGPGAHVHPGESLPATRKLGPFNTLLKGKRTSPQDRRQETGKTEKE